MASRLVQQVETLAAKPDDPSLTPRSNTAEGKRSLPTLNKEVLFKVVDKQGKFHLKNKKTIKAGRG